MTIQALPYITLLGFLFGSSLIASRFSVGQFAPTTYISLRLILATSAYLIIYTFTHYRDWPRDRNLWRHAGLLGLFGTALPMTSIITSLQYQSSGITSILITTGPALTVVLAHFFLPDEMLTKRKSFGVFLALAGALFLAALGQSGLPDVTQANPIGYGLVMLAIIASSMMTIYIRKYMGEFDAFHVASIRMFVAGLAVMPLSLFLIGFDLQAVNYQGYLALGYAALIGTFAAFLLSFYNIQRFGATPAAMTGYIVPIVTTTGGVFVLGETVTSAMLVGMGLILLGIGIINQRQTA